MGKEARKKAASRRAGRAAVRTYGFDAKNPTVSADDRAKIDAFIKKNGVTKIPMLTVEQWLKTPYPDESRRTGTNRKFKFGYR